MGLDTIELVLRVALVLDALALIALIMVQQGKGASMGAAFGSGASQTMFGSAGAASFLTRLTTWLAVVFFVLCFGLAWAARERAESAGTVGIPSLGAELEESTQSADPDFSLPDGDFDPLPADGDVPTLEEAIDDGEASAADLDGDVPSIPDSN